MKRKRLNSKNGGEKFLLYLFNISKAVSTIFFISRVALFSLCEDNQIRYSMLPDGPFIDEKVRSLI